MKHGDALEPTLDPADWDNFRALAREMMDTTVEDLKGLRLATLGGHSQMRTRRRLQHRSRGKGGGFGRRARIF
jgi:hypothetical protein